MALLPALTHFTIKRTSLSKKIGTEYEGIQQNTHSNNDESNINQMYNLVFLSLDNGIYCDFPITQIIKRCPRLKYLLATNSSIYEYKASSPIDFALILKLCPSSRYIHWGGEDAIYNETEKEWLTLSRRSRDTDNEGNNDYGKREANCLRQVGFCSYDEQRHISALTTILQQPSLLEHLHLSGSFQLDLCRLWDTFTQHNSNLLSRPSN